MSLMYCRQEPVKHPYFVEPLGIHLWSSQELCYVIYHNPLLVLDDFVDEHLIAFIREELDMEFLAARLEQMIQAGEPGEVLLAAILSDCTYYNSADQNRFRQEMTALRKLPAAEYARAKGDYLFQLKQYGRAVSIYRRLLEEGDQGASKEPGFLGKVWCSLGCAYARRFQFDKAMSAFEQAHGKLADQEVLKRMYFLTKVHPQTELKERYQSLISEELKTAWDLEIAEARGRAAESEEVKKLDRLFEKDPIKRMTGAALLVKQWKQEYRTMM